MAADNQSYVPGKIARCPSCGFTYQYTEEYAELAAKGVVHDVACQNCGVPFPFRSVEEAGPFYCRCRTCAALFFMKREHEGLSCVCPKCDGYFPVTAHDMLTGKRIDELPGPCDFIDDILIKTVIALVDANLQVPSNLYMLTENFTKEYIASKPLRDDINSEQNQYVDPATQILLKHTEILKEMEETTKKVNDEHNLGILGCLIIIIILGCIFGFDVIGDFFGF